MLILFLIAITASFKPLQKSTTPLIQLDSANFQSKTHIRLYKCCPHESHPLEHDWIILFRDKKPEMVSSLEALAKGYHVKQDVRVASVDWYSLNLSIVSRIKHCVIRHKYQHTQQLSTLPRTGMHTNMTRLCSSNNSSWVVTRINHHWNSRKSAC